MKLKNEVLSVGGKERETSLSRFAPVFLSLPASKTPKAQPPKLNEKTIGSMSENRLLVVLADGADMCLLSKNNCQTKYADQI